VSEPHESAFLVEPGWGRSICTRPWPGESSVRALFYDDGTCRIEHKCKVIGGVQIICAPALRLADGHTIVAEDPLTVTPSILCPDCGLHGFITEGRWVSC